MILQWPEEKLLLLQHLFLSAILSIILITLFRVCPVRVSKQLQSSSVVCLSSMATLRTSSIKTTTGNSLSGKIHWNWKNHICSLEQREVPRISTPPSALSHVGGKTNKQKSLCTSFFRQLKQIRDLSIRAS